MLRAVVAALVLSAFGSLRAADVTVFAAASLTDALKEIGADFQKHGGNKIVFNFGASSLLARQIEEGAPADVFLSADEAKMNDLEKKGLIFKDTRTILLSNSLVIVVAVENGAPVANPKDLATDKVKKLALAEPATVPAGIYAREYLVKQSLWTGVEPKVVPTENVRAALVAVESGNADAGMVYKTDAAISKKVKVACEIPPPNGPRISYPVAVTKESKQASAAKQFAAYLRSDDASKVFRKYGFIVAD